MASRILQVRLLFQNIEKYALKTYTLPVINKLSMEKLQQRKRKNETNDIYTSNKRSNEEVQLTTTGATSSNHSYAPSTSSNQGQLQSTSEVN